MVTAQQSFVVDRNHSILRAVICSLEISDELKDNYYHDFMFDKLKFPQVKPSDLIGATLDRHISQMFDHPQIIPWLAKLHVHFRIYRADLAKFAKTVHDIAQLTSLLPQTDDDINMKLSSNLAPFLINILYKTLEHVTLATDVYTSKIKTWYNVFNEIVSYRL